MPWNKTSLQILCLSLIMKAKKTIPWLQRILAYINEEYVEMCKEEKGNTGRQSFVQGSQMIDIKDSNWKLADGPSARNKILQMIHDNPEATVEQMAKATGITIYGTKYHIQKMKKENLIQRIGSSKTGFWKIIE